MNEEEVSTKESSAKNARADAMSSENIRVDVVSTISELLDKAHAAYEADDSQAVADYVEQVLDLDAENVEAWLLRAKFGYWHSKMFDFDPGSIIRSINHALGLIPEADRYAVATDIYTARKRQISLRLEAAIMMPSYQGAKQTHAVMMDWKRLLAEIPYLTPTLIQSEVTLCENICTRSKLGVMPSDRLVYTAYATFNHKESYGESFRKVLLTRAKREQKHEMELLAQAQEKTKQRLSDIAAQRDRGEISAAEEKALLEGEIAALQGELARAEGMSDKKLYQQRLEELQDMRSKLKPYKLLRKRELDEQISEVQQKLSEVDAPLEVTLRSLQSQIDTIQERLATLCR